jgi:hypothetical protein
MPESAGSTSGSHDTSPFCLFVACLVDATSVGNLARVRVRSLLLSRRKSGRFARMRAAEP